MGQAHLLPARSQALQDGYPIPDRLLYIWVHPFTEVLFGYADLHAGNPPVQVGQIAVLLRGSGGGGVPPVVAGDDL